MGKTANFLRSLLGSKKKHNTKCPPSNFKYDDPLSSPYVDANKHAIAVAAATAAVAEAALAAAHAAAEVVRLTNATASGRNVPAYLSCERRRVAAAIAIQSAFRAYLARRALRALKALVKLQALVRGHIVRKQSADMLRRMQAMARIQARASATRSYTSEYYSKTNIKFSNYHHSGVAIPQNYHRWSDNTKQSRTSSGRNIESSHMTSNWLNHWIEQYSWNNSRGDDERSDKILEIDTWKPRQTIKQTDRAFPAMGHQKIGSFSRVPAKLQKPNPSISSEEVSSMMSPKEVDRVGVWTAESSPRGQSTRPTGNARGVFTPPRSECSRSVMGDYLSHPSYMANTESSRAKVRSQSAPKQRMRLDEVGGRSTFGCNAWESDVMSEKGYAMRYVGPGQVKRQGINNGGAPYNGNGIRSSYGYRF